MNGKIIVMLFLSALFLCGILAQSVYAASSVVVFSQAGFPAVDTVSIPGSQLQAFFPDGRFVSMSELAASLKEPECRLLVLPYGSAFPEKAWEDILQFLQRGGNLLVIGGKPFTRSAYHDKAGWHLRDHSTRFTRSLMIDQYQETPGSEDMEFQTNPELALQLPKFSWNRAFSPVIRLSAKSLYQRGGAAGSIDAYLRAFAWGVKNGRKLSAPAIEMDHVRNGFDGGRWIFLNAELSESFIKSGAGLIKVLTERALQGAEEFAVRPIYPLFLPGEPVKLNIEWQAVRPPSTALTAKIAIFQDANPAKRSETAASVPADQPVVLSIPTGSGMHIVEAELMEGARVRAKYRSGFWIRDQGWLSTGPTVTINNNYFELDSKPIAIVGTTYMSSEVQRLFFQYPNVYVWDQDMGQIRERGLNMLRSGWWTGWDKLCDENGVPNEHTLRTIEAFLMTARSHELPVQWTFFAFLPDIFGGENAYLDPAAVRKQRTLISSVVKRFPDVPWLIWDFINEPSISKRLWTMRPNGDSIELQKWNEWLNQRNKDKAALAAAWNVPASSVQGTVPLPEDIDFAARGAYSGRPPVKVYDYYVFAQEVFNDWVKTMSEAVRNAGSEQLITVGQDEGGIQDRVSPAYWGALVDFTTNHSWWQNDHLVWDSLLAKQPGKALLLQETGLQRELNFDETARRTTAGEAALLERKVAASFIQGGGAIEWLWNTNSYMTESNETPIGAVRTDRTEKEEATVMRDYATFAKSLHAYLVNPRLPDIAIVTSQAAQFSPINDMQLEAQRKAVRTLLYQNRLAAYAVAENQLPDLGNPKLAILPSPQNLTDRGWRLLMQYVDAGGNLLITGPVERDEHWQKARRAADLKIEARAESLVYHNAAIRIGDRPLNLSFDQQKQNQAEWLRFSDGSTFKEIAYGKGRVFWASHPVEFNENTQVIAILYAYAAAEARVKPDFELITQLSPGVLVYPTVLEDAVMYIMISDNDEDVKIELRDSLTGTRLTLQLAAQHAAIAVIGKKEKSVIAKYGF
ncbi:MAG: hypothetical protein JXA73_22135 [Acidobacteria bacterium]|nr:hypothetical protein [Acidobacteriota bacterium]